MQSHQTDQIVDFFIVGAPKSGTTSLAYYLGEHPDICFSRIKEPFHYNRESPRFNGIKSSSQYRNLFRHAQPGQLRGEGTTWYLYSNDAIENALQENPSAKFIVCLRNPADAVVSWHSHMILVGAENQRDVNDAWRLQDVRKERGYRPPVYADGDVLQYHDLFKVGTQLEHLYQLVGRERVHVILFDDLKSNSAGVYVNLLQFLGCSLETRSDYPVKYPRSHTKSGLLRWLGSRLSYYQRIQLTYLLDRMGIDLYRIYLGLNTSRVRKDEPVNTLNKEYREVFIPEIELLKTLIERDLSHWD